jgi:tRNA nucleotidyltransferase (CCA-adding enzyme)
MNRLYSLGKQILKELEDHGHEAYFVGGFVRDYLQNQKSLDIDITTDALPDEVEKIFPKTVATGKKYGTVTVFIAKEGFEVTTYRTDGVYLNYRKPEEVHYAKKLEDDLKRRDFTINALAMDARENIVDLFNGRDDLKNGIIRAIGNPDQRFNEDALRMLRAFRFASRLGFKIEKDTLKSIKYNIDKLLILPNERIIPELEETFLSPYNKLAITYMKEANIHKAFPELSSGIDLYKEADQSIDFYEYLALCLYLNKMVLPDYWRFSNNKKSMIQDIVKILDMTSNSNFTSFILYEMGLEKCLKANKISRILFRKDQSQLIISLDKDLPIKSKSELKINGHDIKKIKEIKDEQIIGKILRELELKVVMKTIENNHKILKKHAKQLLEKLDG